MKLDLEALQVALEEERQSWKLEVGVGFERPVSDRELRRLDDVKVQIVKPHRGFEIPRTKCWGDGCTRPVVNSGYCRFHFTRVQAGLDVDDDTAWSDEARLATMARARARKRSKASA